MGATIAGGTRVGVAAGAGVAVAVGVAVATGRAVAVGDGVAVGGFGGVAVGMGLGVAVGDGIAVGVGVGVTVTPGGSGVGVATCFTAITANTEKPRAAPVNSPVQVAVFPKREQLPTTANTLPSSSILVMIIVLPDASRTRTQPAFTCMRTLLFPKSEFWMFLRVT
jgi:hypothetical protein